MKNKTIILNSRPVGTPAKDNFKFIETEVPVLQQGEVLLKALYIYVDPYMRGRMSIAKLYRHLTKSASLLQVV